MFERQTAKKVHISSLNTGQWEKNEGMNPSFIITTYGDKVSRVRILATVVNKFVAEDNNFASATLDDSTDTIRAKTFKTVEPLTDVKVGDLVDIVGKVKEYNGEIYIVPEVVAKVTNPNLELLRKLEIKKSMQMFGGSVPTNEEKENLRKKVLEIIEKDKDGTLYDTLIKGVGEKEDVVEKVVNDLLAEGVCYEPTPGKIKKI